MTSLTIATTQYGLSSLQSVEQFWVRLSSKIQEAAEAGAELILFPEYMTTHLLSLKEIMTHDEACLYLDSLTADYLHFFQQQSKDWNIAILGGTHICKEDQAYANRAHLFFPDGRMEIQNKLQLTPEEQNIWPLIPGEDLHVFETKWGLLSILTCYDIEFPELARAAADRGVKLILCPSYTDSSYGYHRVRHCAQARAIENQLFVALSGIVGELDEGRPQVDRGFSQAGVFAPCDRPFTVDGILQVGDPNQDMTVFANVDFAELHENREHGAVAPFYDRRPALYEREFQKLIVKER
jgi:predicted amidohydrolase